MSGPPDVLGESDGVPSRRAGSGVPGDLQAEFRLSGTAGTRVTQAIGPDGIPLASLPGAGFCCKRDTTVMVAPAAPDAQHASMRFGRLHFHAALVALTGGAIARADADGFAAAINRNNNASLPQADD